MGWIGSLCDITASCDFFHSLIHIFYCLHTSTHVQTHTYTHTVVVSDRLVGSGGDENRTWDSPLVTWIWIHTCTSDTSHIDTHTCTTHTLGNVWHCSNSVLTATINTHCTHARTHPCVVFAFGLIQLGRRGRGKEKNLLKSETLLHQHPLCSPPPGWEQSNRRRRTRGSVVSAGALRIYFEPLLPTDAAA